MPLPSEVPVKEMNERGEIERERERERGGGERRGRGSEGEGGRELKGIYNNHCKLFRVSSKPERSGRCCVSVMKPFQKNIAEL